MEIRCFTRRLRKVGNCYVLTIPPPIAQLILYLSPRGEVKIKVTREGIWLIPVRGCGSATARG